MVYNSPGSPPPMVSSTPPGANPPERFPPFDLDGFPLYVILTLKPGGVLPAIENQKQIHPMTKKLFIATAKIIASKKSTIPGLSPAEIMRIDLAKEFAVLFASENSNFDRHRFLAACEVRQDYGRTQV